MYTKNKMTKKPIKERPVTIRISNELYEFFLEKALNRAQKEKRIVKISEIMRDALERGK